MNPVPPMESKTVDRNARWLVVGICVALAVLVWVAFGQAREFGFVNYDDDENVSGNAHVLAGLSWPGVAWAFTHGQVGRWAPLVTLSHMADSSLYAQWVGGRHLTNIFIHAASSVLLFLALRALTGAMWRSGCVAALFAIHPLRAEAVAWVSSRGELLAGFFFMLALLAYGNYARSHRKAWYWGVLAAYALGLMCKPTILMLPFALLLLDYWPLERRLTRELLLEKIPFAVLLLASCVISVMAQSAALTPIENLSFASRIGNALVSCIVYLRQTFWPMGLAVFYPHPRETLPWWGPCGAFVLLVGITAFVYTNRLRFRNAFAGWGWYLLMLAPVLGIVQIGAQAHADRYTYLPQIGIFIVVVWGVAELLARWENSLEIASVGVAVALVLLMMASRDQVSHWSDSVALWNSAIEATEPNNVAQNNLGNVLLHQGKVDEALEHLQTSLAIAPEVADTHLSMGNALLQKGQRTEAIAQYRRALELRPDFAGAHLNLGAALQYSGQLNEAIAEYERALELNPDLAQAHNNLGVALQDAGRVKEAIPHFQKALELQPGYQTAADNLARALKAL